MKEDSGDSGQKSLTRSNQLSCEEEMKVDLIANQPSKGKQQVLSQVTNSFHQQIMNETKFGVQGSFSPFMAQDPSKQAMLVGNGLHNPQMVRRNSNTVKTKKETQE